MPFNARPNGPIGSAVVLPVSTGSGMVASFNRVPPPSDGLDTQAYFKVETFPPGAVIYRPGDTAAHIYLLKVGRVRLLRAGGGNQRAVAALLKPGDLFEASPGEWAVAASEAEIWSIDARDFRIQLENRPVFAAEVIRAYAERVRLLQRRVIALTAKEVPARLADTLCSLAESHGERCPHGGEVDLKGVTQQDLADLVGASRSFVSTLINEMKRDGLLSNVGRTLCILDANRLQKAASVEK